MGNNIIVPCKSDVELIAMKYEREKTENNEKEENEDKENCKLCV